MRVVCLCLSVMLPLGFGAVPAVGQTVRGAVVDAAIGEPVAGAVVGLLDDEGDWIVGTLSRPGGRFLLRAPEPGRYRLSARAIGREPVETDAFEVELGVAIDRTLHARARRSDLAGLVAEADRECESRPDATDAGRRLWQEAETALAAVALSREAPGLGFHTMRHRREIDVERGWIRSQAVDTTWSFRHRPFRTVSVADVRSRGYVRTDARGTTLYAPPDIDVLRSTSFLSSHCFRPVAGDDGRVGLAFEPTPARRDLPEIEGVFWIDAATGELRRVEFRFTGPATARTGKGFGGELELRRLDNGLRVVRRWWTRVPVVDAGSDDNGVARVGAVRESGGALIRVSGLGAVYSLRPPTGSVEGRLVSATGAPIADARVYLAGTGYATTTDANGDFRLADVLQGRYGLRWRPARADDESVAGEPREIEVREGDVTVAHIESAASASSSERGPDCVERTCRPR